jgi:hypothetical protein
MRVGLQGAADFGVGSDEDETDVHVSKVYRAIAKGEINPVLLDVLRGGCDGGPAM